MVIQTQTGMEELNIGNVKAVLEKGRLNNIVPEQADM
jgi:glyoxylate reductase